MCVLKLSRTALPGNYVFEEGGYEAHNAPNSGDALGIRPRNRDQLSLPTDVMLLLIGGRGMADPMATLTTRTQLLNISANSFDGNMRHGVLERGTNFLQRPFTPDALTRKVRKIIDESRRVGE
jgi:hypothetical protein